MPRTIRPFALLLPILCFVAGPLSTARADFAAGSQGFSDMGMPVVNTGDLMTSTVYTIGDMTANRSRSGSFLSNPVPFMTEFGEVTIDLSDASKTTFGNDSFGHFVGSSIQSTTQGNGARSIYVLGTFTLGSQFNMGATPLAASFIVAFTQASGPGSALSDSASLSVPPAPMNAIPEPASAALLGLGLVGIATLRRRKVGP